MRSQKVRRDLATKQQRQELERHIKLLVELEVMVTFHLSVIVESLLFKKSSFVYFLYKWIFFKRLPKEVEYWREKGCVVNSCFFFWLHWVFAAAHTHTLVWQVGATLHCWMWASHCSAFSCFREQGFRDSELRSWDPSACGTVPDQESNRVPCVGWWVLNHWTTREVL